MKKCVLALALCVITHAGYTAGFRVGGEGMAPCGKVLAHLAEVDDYAVGMISQGITYSTKASQLVQWFSGYITAVNENNEKVGKRQILTDKETIPNWLRMYCTAHPNDRLLQAAMAFVQKN